MTRPKTIPEALWAELNRGATILAYAGSCPILTTALAQVAAGREKSLDAALAGRPRHGGIPAWRQEALARRDAAIYAAARHHVPGLTDGQAAKRLASAIGSYEGRSWSSDRTAGQVPRTKIATLRHDLFLIFGCGVQVPKCAKHVERILKAEADKRVISNVQANVSKMIRK